MYVFCQYKRIGCKSLNKIKLVFKYRQMNASEIFWTKHALTRPTGAMPTMINVEQSHCIGIRGTRLCFSGILFWFDYFEGTGFLIFYGSVLMQECWGSAWVHWLAEDRFIDIFFIRGLFCKVLGLIIPCFVYEVGCFRWQIRASPNRTWSRGALAASTGFCMVIDYYNFIEIVLFYLDLTMGTFSAKKNWKKCYFIVDYEWSICHGSKKIITRFLATTKAKSAMTPPNEHFVDAVRKKRY